MLDRHEAREVGRGLPRLRASLLLVPVFGLLASAALLPTLAARHAPLPPAPSPDANFDAIAVLGFPAREDGTPSAILRERVDAGVRWYRAGVAPRLILSGGPAHNDWIEAEVMAALARAEGVPEEAIVLEPKARSTRENARFVAERMRVEGWRTVLVVSSPSHLRRAALLFRETGLDAAFAPTLSEGALGWLRERAAAIWEAIQILRMDPIGAVLGKAGPRRE